MDKWEGIDTISIVIHSVWSLGGTVFLLEACMYVIYIRTSTLPDCFYWEGGMLKVSQSSVHTTLQKGTDMV